jgi:hypothetical protein
MIRKTTDTSVTKKDAAMLRKAVGRWENEGGAETGGPEAIVGTAPGAAAPGDLRVELQNAELVQLQLRVIALENLVTALLATAPADTTDLVRAIAANISPRPESTQHHLTVRAAAQMIHLLERGQLAKDSRRAGDE